MLGRIAVVRIRTNCIDVYVANTFRSRAEKGVFYTEVYLLPVKEKKRAESKTSGSRRYIHIRLLPEVCNWKRILHMEIFLRIKIMPRAGIEPATREDFQSLCSTN